ncbi:MAG: phenylacetate--CoA ligase [Euryarchaeota archaeon]|nr:phenylacetate--CoA ligase [Euryarchaeota archaeon]
MFRDKAIETMSSEDLQKLQIERLQETALRAQSVPFYRERFKELGLTPDDIQTYDDVKKIPFTTKKDLQQGFPFGFVAVPMRDIIRIHTTSGTTGKPTVVTYTAQDLDTWSELIARNLTMVGLTSDDVFQNMVNYGMFTGGLGFHYGAEKLGIVTIPAATGNTHRQIEMLYDFGVTAIHCTPSYAMRIAEVSEEMGIILDKLKYGVFGAEPWSEALRSDLEKRLGVEAFDSYGMSELFGPGVAFECKEHNGLHIWHDIYYAEIIDPNTGETLPPGHRGELVVTPLLKEAMPLLRYRTGDITMLMPEPCPCGRGMKIARMTGRSDDMLIIRGINVFPSQIEHVIKQIPGIGDQFMVTIERVNHLDEMTISAEITDEVFNGELDQLTQLRTRVVQALKERLELRTTIHLVERGSLPRFEGKAKRVIDLREKA